MGLLDSLFGGGGLLPSWMQQQPQPAGQMPTAPQPGLMDRLVAGFQGAANSGSPMAALGNLAGGLYTGSRTDPAGAQQAGVTGMLNQLVASGQITPTQARFLAANPKAWEELSKAMINQPTTQLSDGTVIQQRPFGQVGIPNISVNGSNVPLATPVVDPSKVVNPDGSRSDAYNIRPSLTRPQGGVVIPGQQPPTAQAPPGAPSGQPGAPLLNPNLPRGGRPIISEQSPAAIEEQQARGKTYGADFDTIQSRARSAIGANTSLRSMLALGREAFEGPAAPLATRAGAFLQSLGLSSERIRRATTASEVFQALESEITLASTPNGSLGAQISNADRDYIAAQFPSLSRSAEGREQLVNYLIQLNERRAEVGRLAESYVNRVGSMRGFNDYLRTWAENNPIFQTRSSATPPPNVPGTVPPPAQPGDPGYRVLRVR